MLSSLNCWREGQSSLTSLIRVPVGSGVRGSHTFPGLLSQITIERGGPGELCFQGFFAPNILLLVLSYWHPKRLMETERGLEDAPIPLLGAGEFWGRIDRDFPPSLLACTHKTCGILNTFKESAKTKSKTSNRQKELYLSLAVK